MPRNFQINERVNFRLSMDRKSINQKCVIKKKKEELQKRERERALVGLNATLRPGE